MDTKVARDEEASVEDAWRALEALGAQARRHETQFQGGKRLVWNVWGEGPPMLLFHGGGGSWTHWYTTIPALSARRTVWIPDLPGYGDSDMPEGTLSCDAIAGFVVDGFRDLMAEDETFDVAGFSFGAQMATRAVLKFGERVERLVIVGMNFVETPRPRLNLVNWKKCPPGPEREAAIRANVLSIMIRHETNLDEFVMRMQRANLARQRLSPIALEGMPTMHEDLPRLPGSVRVTAISGRQDFIAETVMDRQAEGIAALKPGSDFHVVESSGHWVMHENPGDFNARLLEVLDA